MKNLKNYFFIAAAAVAMVFTSCADDEGTDKSPDIKFIGGANYVSGDETVFTGETFVVGITAAPNIDTKEKLVSLSFTRTFNNIPTDTTIALDKLTSFNIDITITARDTEGTERIVFVVEDKKGETAELVLNITTKKSTNPLSAEKAFEWQRVGGNDATGLDKFGLSWTSNTATAAIIKKDADKFVKLAAADWAGITSKEALKSAIDAATDMADFRDVSVTENKTYDIVLGTLKGTDYFLIHLTNSSVTTGGAGTTITVTGDYKE